MRLSVQSERGAYVALVVLTLVWGTNWIAMKQAVTYAHPVVFNIARTWTAILVLFAALIVRRQLKQRARGVKERPRGVEERPNVGLLPESWLAVAITGFFQTTMNMGSTTMAVADGGAGRAAVLVFTMPFWTLLIAWPVLNERVRGIQWLAIGLALAGLVLVVEPWRWEGGLKSKAWAILSGFGWACGTIAMKFFQRTRNFDMLNFITWQMLLGVLPLCLLPVFLPLPETRWSAAYVALLLVTGALASGFGFVLWVGVLRFLSAGTASLNMLAIPVIALLSSMAVFDEKLSRSEWIGIACIGAGLVVISIRAWLAARRGERPLPDPIPQEGG
jgi:drug/metabolite transporter (DMT)-like permease